MTSGETLAELERLGVVLEPNGDKLRYRAPQGALTPELREAITENKAEIISTLRRLGDGQAPPLDRAPQTEQELLRWMDHTADPEVFVRWLEWAMDYTDPAEGGHGHHQRHVGADSQADADNNL